MTREALGARMAVGEASGGLKVREGGRKPCEGAPGGGGAKLGQEGRVGVQLPKTEAAPG